MFEKCLEVALRAAADTKEVISQHAEKRLLRNKRSGRGNSLLKPDFVVDNKMIIDTKWKSATYDGRSQYVQSDVYQMFAYVTAYKGVDRCILLYPKQECEAEYSSPPVCLPISYNQNVQNKTIYSKL